MTDAGGSAEQRGLETPAIIAIVAGIVIVVVVAGVVAVSVFGGDDEATTVGEFEVFLEPVDFVGVDPFFEEDSLVDATPVSFIPRGPGVVDPTQPPTATPVPEPDETETAEPDTAETGEVLLTSAPGTEPGLYGGTRDSARCNKTAMVDFLSANPDKAAAWAAVQGVSADAVSTFVGDLTPAMLLTDTRVTNHGFVDGAANPLQSVLQAGTAVLVDDFGVPRAKCSCGNPLLEPNLDARTVTIKGDPWDGFSPRKVEVVNPGPGPIDIFILQDVDGGDPFTRPVSSDGTADAPAPDDIVLAVDTILPSDGADTADDPDAADRPRPEPTEGDETPTPLATRDAPAPDGPRAFTVVFPTGDETCDFGVITDVQPLTLVFAEDGSVAATGSITCDIVATLSGEGTWDAEAATYEITISFGAPELGFTEFPLAGGIDFADGTIEADGEKVPITSIDG